MSNTPAKSFKAKRSEAPKPIWAPFPLTELMILVGLLGAITGVAANKPRFIVGGLLLVFAASIELSAREHFAGYRSHSAMLATFITVAATVGVAYLNGRLELHLPWAVFIAVPVAVFVAAFAFLRRKFLDVTGISFRV